MYTKFAQELAEGGQRVPVRADQVTNNAGGYVFQITDWQRLDRFLIIGSDSNTYYQSAKELTIENAQVVVRLLKEDGKRVVSRIVTISDSGRAKSNEQALFALALALSPKFSPDVEVRQFAAENARKVARNGTHLFHLWDYLAKLRGNGRIQKRIFKDFYENERLNNLAYQVVKYAQRDGLSHRDVMRMCRPKTSDTERQELFSWIIRKGKTVKESESADKVYKGKIDIVIGSELAVGKPNPELITKYRLPREVLPTEWLNDRDVWDAMLNSGALLPEAIMRNLPKMTNVGLLEGENLSRVCNTFTNLEVIRQYRLHPFKLLTALKVYEQGHGEKGSLKWNPIKDILIALEEGFYTSFKAVEPTGKKILAGLDVSGSMATPMPHMGNMSVAMAASAIAMTYYMTEENVDVMAFNDGIQKIKINKEMRLPELLKYTNGINFGGTDCALPMQYALKAEKQVDLFLVITDNETHSGRTHPFKALQQYRERMGIDAKLAVLGCTATNFTIADPKDKGMMDFVGFDASVPDLISQFAMGNI